jgi:RecA-family ATPase
VTHTVKTESDINAMRQMWGAVANPEPAIAPPSVLTVEHLLALDIPTPGMLIDGVVPMRGASLIVGTSKSGKTLLAAQSAIAVASGTALFGQYRVLHQGPALMIEQDDPAATASIKDVLQRSPVPVAGIPFLLVPRVSFTFGPEFIAWLEGMITERSLRLVVLDSYTALRGPRARGGDIVKAEQDDLTHLDGLAKRTDCAILIVHHCCPAISGTDSAV